MAISPNMRDEMRRISGGARLPTPATTPSVRTDRATAAGGATGASPSQVPPELQQFFQQQREQVRGRTARHRESEQRAMKRQLAGSGLAGSGIAQAGAERVGQQSRVAEEEALKDISGQEQIARFQFGETERGRRFQTSERVGTQAFEAEQNDRNRALQKGALDLQRNLGLGYTGPDGKTSFKNVLISSGYGSIPTIITSEQNIL